MEDEHKTYPCSNLPEQPDMVSEPQLEYNTVDSQFEKDWQRGMSINDFREYIFDRLETVYGR